MKPNPRTTDRHTAKPKVIVLAHSKAWCAMIRRTLGQANLCWVLDADALEAEAAKLDARAAVVEIPINRVDDLCVRLSLLNNNSAGLKIFAVGDSDLYHWRRLLQVAGVAMSAWSVLQAPSLACAVDRHLSSTPELGPQTLQTIVEADLPWPTAANRSTA